jgi:hypothetical protein
MTAEAATKRLSSPQRADTQKVSTSLSGSDFVGSTSGSRVRTFPAAKAWTPTLSTSVACVPGARERLTFAPSAFAVGRHRVVSR